MKEHTGHCKPSLVSCKDLSIGYGKKVIVSSIDLEISSCSLWGIIGPNGAGKTTLIRTILGMLKPLQGEMKRKDGIKFGYVKQRHTLNVLYPFSVFEVVMMGRYGMIKPPRRPSVIDVKKVEEALEFTGISDLRDEPVRELSGGQRQRVLIARALCSEPELIILDEPTNDMDVSGEEAVLSLIKKIHSETCVTVIIVSHLLHVVLNIAEQIMFMKEGKISVLKREELIYEDHLERFYSVPIKIIEKRGRYSVITEPKLHIS